MDPLAVAALVADRGGPGFRRVAIEPLGDVVVEKLLRPQDAREGLALNAAQVLVHHLALQFGIEGIGLGLALGEEAIEMGEGRGLGRAQAQPDPDGGAAARRHGAPVDAGRLGALVRADGLVAASHQVIVEAVLVQMSRLVAAEQFRDIALVLAELDLVRRVEVDRIGAERLVPDHDIVVDALEGGFGAIGEPAPGVAKPHLGQHVDRRFVGTAVVDGQTQQNVVGAGLGIFDVDVEVAVVVEDAGLDDLEFGLLAVAPRVLLQQEIIGKCSPADTCRASGSSCRSAPRRDSSRVP